MKGYRKLKLGNHSWVWVPKKNWCATMYWEDPKSESTKSPKEGKKKMKSTLKSGRNTSQAILSANVVNGFQVLSFITNSEERASSFAMSQDSWPPVQSVTDGLKKTERKRKNKAGLCAGSLERILIRLDENPRRWLTGDDHGEGFIPE